MVGLIYFFAEFGGWASDVEQDVFDFYQESQEKPSLVVTGVKLDRFFSGSANLCLREKIHKIQRVQALFF